MERKAAKELLHVQGRLDRVEEVIERGKETYLGDDLLQEAGDSLMMKLGEAANRLSKLGVLAPDGVEWALAVAKPKLPHPPATSGNGSESIASGAINTGAVSVIAIDTPKPKPPTFGSS
ncbi:hypothetical protein OG921_15695 [Aldersonia sp. NBC_00410]|uniref:hypothetical protein n=1 Tax=Aldersonia sp. NBC_00410 TaxID=2975954 RepID=UPI002257412F|nr:hypothetical protein [Aldersonia sp. NBC_00410]MCX5044613.1 hypothetical protein [Aldersonia sp. NBC_00410]